MYACRCVCGQNGSHNMENIQENQFIKPVYSGRKQQSD